MQQTRLNRVYDRLTGGLADWLSNPWRRWSVLIISLLLGNFLGTAVSTISGQTAEIDVLVSAILVALTEFISWITYRSRPKTARSLVVQVPNALKLGLMYSLFVEAFKLGS